MITISITELKRFLANSKNISARNSILPILEYVKLEYSKEKTTISKTDLNSFVVVDVEGDFKKGGTLIIEEKALNAAVTYAKSDHLTISKDGINVILDDGKRPIKSQTHPDNNFPVIQALPSGDGFEMTKEMIDAFSLAKQHLLKAEDAEMRSWKTFVCVKKVGDKSVILGTNGTTGYFEYFDEAIPEFALIPEVVGIISKYPMLTYHRSEKFDFFSSVGTVYGFIQSETNIPDITPVLNAIRSEDSFEIKREPIVNACECAMALNSNSSVVSQMVMSDAGEGKVRFEYHDASDSCGFPEEMEVIGKGFEVTPTALLAKNLITCLKDLKGDSVVFERFKGGIAITSPEQKNYIGYAMEILLQA